MCLVSEAILVKWQIILNVKCDPAVLPPLPLQSILYRIAHALARGYVQHIIRIIHRLLMDVVQLAEGPTDHPLIIFVHVILFLAYASPFIVDGYKGLPTSVENMHNCACSTQIEACDKQPRWSNDCHVHCQIPEVAPTTTVRSS